MTAAILCLVGFAVSSSWASRTSRSSVEGGVGLTATCAGMTDSDCVNKCFNDEAERLEQQAKEKANRGFWGALADTVGSVLPGPIGSVVSGVAELSRSGLETRHALDNLDADSCEQMFAGVALEKISNIESGMAVAGNKLNRVAQTQTAIFCGLNSIYNDMHEIDAGTKAQIKTQMTMLTVQVNETSNKLSSQIGRILDQGRAAQAQVRVLETKMDLQMRQVARTQAHLSNKLDLVSSQVLANRNMLNENHYSLMTVALASSMAEVSGAFQDLISIQDELGSSTTRLMTTEKTRVGLVSWGLERQDLKTELRMRLFYASQRARDGLAKALSIVVNGNFLHQHYALQILGLTVAFLESRPSCTAALTELRSDFGPLASAIRGSLLGEDQILQLLSVGVAQYEAVASFSSMVFGNVDAHFPPALTPAVQMLLRMKDVKSSTWINDAMQVAVAHVCQASEKSLADYPWQMGAMIREGDEWMKMVRFLQVAAEYEGNL
jgi:hypothetical protein